MKFNPFKIGDRVTRMPNVWWLNSEEYTIVDIKGAICVLDRINEAYLHVPCHRLRFSKEHRILEILKEVDSQPNP